MEEYIPVDLEKEKINDAFNPPKKVNVYTLTIHFPQKLQKYKVDNQFLKFLFKILGYSGISS